MNFLQHTHNLNIIIIDDYENVIINKQLLENIYNEIADKIIIKKGKFLNTNFEVQLLWNKLQLTDAESRFLGKLFIFSPYSDFVLYETTKIILQEIENKLKLKTIQKNWKIVFHISRLLENMNKKYEIKIM